MQSASNKPETTNDDYAIGASDVMVSPFGSGLMAAATGNSRSANPHATDGVDWQEWMRGFQAWEDAPKYEIEIPDA